MAIATLRSQDLQCGATAQILALVGKRFWSTLNIDLLDLVHNYVWLLWLCCNLTDSTWLEKSFTLFVPNTPQAEQFWISQQDYLGCVPRCSFAREYACIAACPWIDEKELKVELEALKERMNQQTLDVVPEMPHSRFWYEHDAAVLAQDALPTPRPLPCVRSSAAPALCFWGNGDRKRGTMDRRKMMSETQVQTFLPQDMSLDAVVGEKFLEHCVVSFKSCKMPVPLMATCCLPPLF